MDFRIESDLDRKDRTADFPADDTRIKDKRGNMIVSTLNVLIESKPFCLFDDTPMKDLYAAGLHLTDMRGFGTGNSDFMKALQASDIVLSGNDLKIDDALLEQCPRMKAVAKLGVGLDTIDIPAATRRSILVFHTPEANTQAVSDHTFALILSVARKILFCDRSLRENRWEHTKIMGFEIWQKTLGLIGLGAIGQGVARRAKGFNMKLVACDPYWPEAFADEHAIEKMEVEELLNISDIVSIHSPLTPENMGMINKRTLSMMKSSAFLINTARGEIINEADLCQALKEGKIAGAGLDVFEHEPPVGSPLLGLDNVVLTPHTAAFTQDALKNMSVGIAAQIIDYARGTRPRHTVNKEVWEKSLERRKT